MRTSTKTVQRVALEQHNILELLKIYGSLEGIAVHFNTNISTVHRVGKQQSNLLDINKFEKSKEKVEFLGTKGAWKELKETPLYKQIMYGRR